jgi:hypothetical protein
MTVAATERAVLEALRAVRSLLEELAHGGADTHVATRSFGLLQKYEKTGINERTCEGLGADLAKGVRDWKWSDPGWKRLGPLVDALESSLACHFDALRAPPNNSFEVTPDGAPQFNS